MPHPYFFGTRISTGTTFFLLAMLPTLSSAAEPGGTSNPMSMYFDDSQMVEVATRAPKPMRQVAENVTVITAEEIESMHVHTVSEVLSRESAMFMTFFGQDFGSSANHYTLGSNTYHTLVLIDGVRLNGASGGDAFTNFIPLGIVKRIEIIKGPASSTWGSSLGGVVNIITKDTGNTDVPQVSLGASYGEAASRETSIEAAGKAGTVGYFIHAGAMDSNGLEGRRFFDRESVFAKARIPLSDMTSVNVFGGYSDPSFRPGDFYSQDIDEVEHIRNFWGAVQLDHQFSKAFNLHVEATRYDRDFIKEKQTLGLVGVGFFGGFPGAYYTDNYNELTEALNSRLTYNQDWYAITLGAETSRNELGYYYDYGPQWGGPASSTPIAGKDERQGYYANVTFNLGNFSLTPGVRYDNLSASKDFLSPSLGATYMLATDTLLRASVAKGFSAPYLSLIYGTAGYLPSPNLKPEVINSFQAGIETTRIDFLRIKATLFHQAITDKWFPNDDTLLWENQGKETLQGLDLEAKTNPWHDLSVTANGAYVLMNTDELDNAEMYSANLTLNYDATASVKTQLAGRYIWWNAFNLNENPKHDTFVWDASVTKTLSWKTTNADIFLAAHNLFNGSQYWDYEYPNPGRWVEAGMRFRF